MENINSRKRKCGFCNEDIEIGWRRCPYCGSLLFLKNDMNIPQAEPGSYNMEGKQYEINDEIMDSNQPKPELGEAAEQAADGNGTISSVEEPAAENRISIEGTLPHNHVNSRRGKTGKRPLSNGKKVFLSVVAAVIPGLGQLIGLIAAIVYMNSEDDTDRRSFGVSLLVASLLLFVFSCLYCSVLIMAFFNSFQG